MLLETRKVKSPIGNLGVAYGKDIMLGKKKDKEKFITFLFHTFISEIWLLQMILFQQRSLQLKEKIYCYNRSHKVQNIRLSITLALILVLSWTYLENQDIQPRRNRSLWAPYKFFPVPFLAGRKILQPLRPSWIPKGRLKQLLSSGKWTNAETEEQLRNNSAGTWFLFKGYT